ncbi:MAG: hypothetical protein IKP10_02040 [Clostridia bacterium]|nr:hypothetical protein [Clostridia bacterium]
MCHAKPVRLRTAKLTHFEGMTMYVYCLFCRTQRCRVIADLLEKKGADRAISPQIISRQRKQGRIEEHRHDLLPGYVFVYMDEPLADYAMFAGIDGVIRRLATDGGGDTLAHSDYEFAMELYRKDGVMGALTVLKEHDRVRIRDPFFESFGGIIEYIDHRKQRAKVRFRFDSQERVVWVACDVIYKDDQTNPSDGKTT